MGNGRESGVDRAGLDIPLPLRATELFAVDDGRVHAVYCLRGGDVTFYAGERQVEGGSSPGIDKVEVRFRGSKIKVEEGRFW